MNPDGAGFPGMEEGGRTALHVRVDISALEVPPPLPHSPALVWLAQHTDKIIAILICHPLY